ncbi:MAG: hypothetical protein ACK53V_21100, partial [Planctomycetota bacterium]
RIASRTASDGRLVDDDHFVDQIEPGDLLVCRRRFLRAIKMPLKRPHEDVIEACRKADWIDATLGWFRKGMSRRNITLVEKAFPNCGFHASLLRLAKEYGGSTIVGGIKVTRGILKW